MSDLDVGIQSFHRPSYETQRSNPDTLRPAYEIGAEIAITVYGLSENHPTADTIRDSR